MPEPRRSLFELVAAIPALIGDLFRAELEALKADLLLRAKRVGIGAGLIAAALVVLSLALVALVVAAIAALALVLPWWASALIVAAALLIVAGILGWVAVGRFKGAAPDIGGRVESIKEDVKFVQGVRKGRRA